ncbi:MAG: PGF-pre-PGF domain-containing protein [Methanosarcinales archaeon]
MKGKTIVKMDGKRWNPLLILAIGIILISIAVSAGSSIPTPHNEFNGTATLNGDPVFVGDVISAYVDGELRGSTVVTTPGKYGDIENRLSVEGSDGETITFKINGVETGETALWQSYARVRVLNLSAPSDLSPPLNAFYGNVTLDGEPAPVGIVVSAYVDGLRRGSTVVTTPGRYGDAGFLNVSGTNGETITFKINGTEASETATWQMLAPPRELDLTAGEGETPTPTPTPGTTGDVVINEIMYNPDGDDRTYEWIELYNRDTETVDLDGWILNGSMSGSDTVLSGTMEPDTYLVLAKDPTAFHERYPLATCRVIQGNWTYLTNLGSSSKKRIDLHSRSGLIDTVNYGVVEAREDYSAERNATDGWEESLLEGGTPCSENSVLGTPQTSGPTGKNNDGGHHHGGGGGGSISSPDQSGNLVKGETRCEWLSIGVPAIYRFTTPELPVYEVNITPSVSAGEICVRVELLKNTSELVREPAWGKVYKNVNIWVGTTGFAVPENIKEAVISFRVENSWMSDENVQSEDIRMLRWNGTGWNSLEIEEADGSDPNYTYFKAMTNAFSPFAIVAEVPPTGKVTSHTTPAAPSPVGSEEESAAAEKTPTTRAPGFEVLWSAMAVLFVAYLSIRRKH